MSELPPKGSAREGEMRAEAQRSVDGQEHASGGQHKAVEHVAPERDQGASDERDPAYSGGRHDEQLEAEGAVVDKSDRAAFWTMIATVALAVGTLGLAIATFDMAHSTRSLVKLAQRQAHDTQDALTVSRRQASAAEAANKLSATPEVSLSLVTAPNPVPNQKLTATYSAFNVGRIAAREVQARATMVLVNPPQLPASMQFCSTCEKSLLFPTQGFQGSGLSLNASISAEKMTDTIVSQIKSQSILLYVLGRIDYLDGDRTRHTILMCDVYNPDLAGVGPCASGNDVN